MTRIVSHPLIKSSILPTSISFSKLLRTALTICLLFPFAAFAQYNSLAEAKAHYSNTKPCDDLMNRLIIPSIMCTKEGKGLLQCYEETPLDVTTDFLVFTRHRSDQNHDPVSITTIGRQTCIYTALDPTSPVTKTCFSSLENRTVETIPSLSLHKAHEGLEMGQSVLHIGMHSKADSQKGCGYFDANKAPPPSRKKAVCLLTSLEKEGPVSQVCFEPEHPESLSLKEAPPGIQLTKPSILISDPQTLSLDVNPTCSSTEKKGISLWEVLQWWWSGKSPCDSHEDL